MKLFFALALTSGFCLGMHMGSWWLGGWVFFGLLSIAWFIEEIKG